VDRRFKKINHLLTEYAQGNFDKKLKLSNSLDEVDSFIACVNMLGEELKDSTISKNYFNNIFNSVSDMIFVLDLKGRILITSESVNEILNIDVQQYKQVKIDSLLSKKTVSLFQFIEKSIKTKKQSVEVETIFETKDGIKIPVLCSAISLFDDDKVKTGYLINAKDLTDIKKYERSLQESEKKYQKLFEESSDCIFITDREGNFLDLNMAGYNLFKTIEPAGASFNLFSLIYKTAYKKLFLADIKKNKNVANFNIQIKCSDENIIDCLISASIIEDENKATIGYRGIIKDISKQKEMEHVVFKTIVHTQEEERKRFAKDIHDSIGQQLSAIKFYIGTSVSVMKDEKQKALLTKANDGLVRALSEIRNICFNLMPRTLENFGLAESLQELCKQTEVNETLTFTLKVDDQFPFLNKQLEISIFRVVQEFINNSLKHSGADKISIELSKKNSTIIILLKDNGKGFDIEKANNKGGMGLKNVNTRLLPYNGEIIVTSSTLKGTQYKIFIPLTPTNVNNVKQ
jgi:PAS domain S-box-containing protein